MSKRRTKEQLTAENEILKKALADVYEALNTPTQGKHGDYDHAYRTGVAQSIVKYVQASDKINIGIVIEN